MSTARTIIPHPAVPRYFRGNRSHGLVWPDTHLIFFPYGYEWGKGRGNRKAIGVAVKRCIDRSGEQAPRGVWRITTLRFSHRPPTYPGYRHGRTTLELNTYRAYAFKRKRIKRSKKYVRFSVCL